MSKLNVLGAWNGGLTTFFTGKSAQSFMGVGLTTMAVSGSCGAGDDDKKEEKKSGACGASCGAGDDGKKPEKPKPSACGSSCGAGDDKGKPQK